MQTDGLKQVREVAKAMQTGLFADRETLVEAFNYMHQVASGCNNSVSVLTAIHVVLNTAAKQIEKECDREMVKAENEYAVFREIAQKSFERRQYNPDPNEMACADRLNKALFAGAWITRLSEPV